MAKKKLDSGRREFSDMVLTMLEEGSALRSINLRQIAKRIGCAHTNAYNYVKNYDELIWFALQRALMKMLATAGVDEREEIDYQGLPDIISCYIDFALSHPSWYRLIWMEQMISQPSAEVRESLSLPGDIMEGWFAVQYPDCRDIRRRSRLFHSFLHGILAKITTGRVQYADSSIREEIIADANVIREMIFTGDLK